MIIKLSVNDTLKLLLLSDKEIVSTLLLNDGEAVLNDWKMVLNYGEIVDKWWRDCLQIIEKLLLNDEEIVAKWRRNYC